MYCPEPSADNGPVNLHIERFDDIEQSIYSLEGIHKLGTYIYIYGRTVVLPAEMAVNIFQVRPSKTNYIIIYWQLR